jgi:hypothetical protein
MHCHLVLLIISFFLLGCSNFEELRKAKFEPDHAAKYTTTFLPSKPVNGRFEKSSLAEGEPLMLLKRGFGYSVYQLWGGRIGEVSNEAVRPKKERETFEEFYFEKGRILGSESISPTRELIVKSSVSKLKTKQTGSQNSESREEVFPILNNSMEKVEPDLPEW